MSFMCIPSDMHPYECDGKGQCVHCDRVVSAAHDPRMCALCEDEYIEDKQSDSGSNALTREQMVEKYGSLPMGMPKDTPYRWTICRAHADVTWTTKDGGDTWAKGDITWAAERARRDNDALEMQRIQQELK